MFYGQVRKCANHGAARKAPCFAIRAQPKRAATCNIRADYDPVSRSGPIFKFLACTDNGRSGSKLGNISYGGLPEEDRKLLYRQAASSWYL